MILGETFVSINNHFDFARKAQSENPYTLQNQMVEWQKAALASQVRAQSVPEVKTTSTGIESGPKKEKKKEAEVLSYSRKGIEYTNTNRSAGSKLDSKV